MRILGVIKEGDPRETRVALVPEVVAGLVKDQIAEVLLERGAGLKAGFFDEDYQKAGATIIDDRALLIKRSSILLTFNGVLLAEEDLGDKMIVGLFDPFFHKDAIKKLCAHNASLLSLELIPRISRAQSMDVLSSQANIAGYYALLLAANKLNKIMPMLMTAAGTIKPAKVLIVGAGVAGLAAIATAKRLGAVVHAYDVRAAAKEQVESLGAKFIDIKIDESGEGQGGYAKELSEKGQAEQRHKLAIAAKDMDIIITTALIPGRSAPLLLDEQIFSLMKKGSVVIDMAASHGGNVAGTLAHEWVLKNDILLYGAVNLSRMVPKDASFTFSKNLRALLELLLQKDQLDLDDEIIRDALLCHDRAFINPAFKKSIE